MDCVELGDGRRLDLRVTGPKDGPVLVFHHGTPGAAVRDRLIEQPAAERGFRVVSWSRPGYGDSTRQPGRRVVDVVADAEAVLAALGVNSCVVGGGSGGGPHALACAARLEAARAVLVVAGVAPFDADGLDFLAGMGEDNIVEFGHAVAGEELLRPYLDAEREQPQGTVVELVDLLSSLLPEVDRRVLTDTFAEDVIASMQEALRTGVDGWLDDDLAFVQPWGFDLDRISTPTLIWHGSEDQFSPIAHGRWLASHVPGASGHLLDGEGHLSMWVDRIPAMLDELLAAARLR